MCSSSQAVKYCQSSDATPTYCGNYCRDHANQVGGACNNLYDNVFPGVEVLAREQNDALPCGYAQAMHRASVFLDAHSLVGASYKNCGERSFEGC